jgi:predicted phage-related endonuclease
VKSIAEVLASIPVKADRFPHLAELSTHAMLLRRVEITEQIKRLEEERKEIDAELAVAYSDAELRFGVQFGGGCILKQCHRTSWIYDQQTRDAIKALQQEAQRRGNAIPQVTAYLQASCMRRKELSR